jgi:hypothetical protein
VWDLKNGAGKVAYFGILLWIALRRGVIVILAYLGICWLGGAEPNETLGLWLSAADIVGMGIWIAIKFRRRNVKESRERMSDPQYRDFVHRLTALKHHAT